MNSRTQAEKQFSIDSILGKEVEMLNKTLKNTLISNEKKLHRVKQMFLSFFSTNFFRMKEKIQTILHTSVRRHHRNLSTEKCRTSVSHLLFLYVRS